MADFQRHYYFCSGGRALIVEGVGGMGRGASSSTSSLWLELLEDGSPQGIALPLY